MWTHAEPGPKDANNELGSCVQLAYVKWLAINQCLLIAGPVNHLRVGRCKEL